MPSKTNSKFAKAKLLTAIQELLQKGTMGTHENIRQVLHKKGIDVNQAMISRLLHRLGAIKMNEGGRTVYRLPAELVAVTAKNSLSQLILGISSNETLIVIQTMPGSAQLVAGLLDQSKQIGILGTVAGDDTVLIVPDSIKKIQALVQNISKILL
ncbi:MAG: ArgR family transcriptional regulator [Gammaproteobacteria bacterium]